MKLKMFSILAVVLFMSSSFSATVLVSNEDDSSDYLNCLREAQALVTEAANENGESPNDDPIYMDAYLFLAKKCKAQN